MDSILKMLKKEYPNYEVEIYTFDGSYTLTVIGIKCSIHWNGYDTLSISHNKDQLPHFNIKEIDRQHTEISQVIELIDFYISDNEDFLN